LIDSGSLVIVAGVVVGVAAVGWAAGRLRGQAEQAEQIAITIASDGRVMPTPSTML